MDRGWQREVIRPTMTRDFLAQMEYPASSMAMPMDVDDDYDFMDTFYDGGGLFSSLRKPEDANFFNSFDDDFDDSDIN